MLVQVFQCLRCPELLQVGRRGYDNQLCIFQQPGSHRGIRLSPYSNRQVVSLCNEVDISIAQVDINGHIRVQVAKFRQQRQDPVVPIRGGQTDAKTP